MTTEKGLVTMGNLTREQIDLIKHTVAIGATDNELKLFLYQAEKRGLDPLLRQIHFIKRRQYNPDTEKYDEVGTIQTGIDGFRVVANRTRKLSGIKRGILTKANGDLAGAWAEVYRSDWQHPAREEVSFNEYCQKKKDGTPMRLWATMPETMIKKVAEAAALRMAFPEDLSGIYTHDEMQQADIEVLPIPEHKGIAKPDLKQAEQDSRDYFAEGGTKPEPLPDELSAKKKLVKEEVNIVVPKEEVKAALQKPKRDPATIIDMEWLKENLKIAKWTEATLISWLKSKANYRGLDFSSGLENIVKQMNKQQAEFLVKEIEARGEMA